MRLMILLKMFMRLCSKKTSTHIEKHHPVIKKEDKEIMSSSKQTLRYLAEVDYSPSCDVYDFDGDSRDAEPQQLQFWEASKKEEDH